MTLSPCPPTPGPTRTDWTAVVRELGPRFATRAAAHDANDSFVGENFADLKGRRVFSAGVPEALGGGGASHAELCAMLRALAHYCGSTALALSMHTHSTMLAVRRWRREPAAVEPLLRRIAAEELVLVTSGGSDWLAGSGRAEPVDGGFRVTARKVFASGSPAGRLLVTSAVLDDPAGGPTVLHFAVPLSADGVTVEDTWRALGMRGTGSNDIVLDGVFVPEAAINASRPSGRWSPLFHTVCIVAFPLVYAVYVGIAEAARDLAVREAWRRRDDADVQFLVGEMENELALARLALDRMVDTAAGSEPGPETTNGMLIARTLAGRAAIRTVERAMEVTGGAAFLRGLGLERLYRDVQAARFHPLREKPQLRYTGRLALGLDVSG